MPRPLRALLLLLLLGGAGRPVRADDPSDAAAMKVALDPSGEVDAIALAGAWARRFGAFYVPDPALAGVKVRFTLAPEADLTWGTVKAILELHDVVVVEERPHVVGPWLIKAHHRRSLTGGRDSARPGRLVDGAALPPTDELVTAVFRIRHGAGATIFATLRGLLSVRDPNRVGNVLFVQGPELVIVADLAPRVRWASDVVRALDVAGPRRELATIPLKHAPAAEVARALAGLLQALQPAGAQQLGPAQAAQGPFVHADGRANQLIVAADPVDLPLVERLVQDLDVAVGPPGGRLHVYRCKDADAAELAATIEKLYGGAAPAPAGPPPATVGGAPVGEVRTRVVADEPTNTLLVEAEEPRWREIEAVLRALDTKRLRVHILCEVWEVSTPNDQLAVSVELAGLTNVVPGTTRPLALTSFGGSTLSVREQDGQPVGVGRTPSLGSGLTAVIAKDALDRLPIVISALASLSEARLVTRPFATTDDGRQATFTITTSQPVLKISSTQISQAQEADYVDASTTLGIEPRINSDRSLTLKLTLTIAAFTGSGSPNLPPPRTTRSYTGEVTVPNERWVAFGGLESESETTDEAKVPFLGDVPVLGHLFKSWRRTRAKTRVYVFVRPTIFSDPDALADARAGEALRRRVHSIAGRDDWLPPVVPEPRPAGWDLEDEAIEVFGGGSADPFRRW